MRKEATLSITEENNNKKEFSSNHLVGVVLACHQRLSDVCYNIGLGHL